MALKGILDDNQRLADTAIARQQDTTLDKINQTLVNYRNFLIYRNRARVVAGNFKVSKYHDLIVLTEDIDDLKDYMKQYMKGVGQALEMKGDMIEEKYKILNDLKDEMMSLNDKFKGGTSRKVILKDWVRLTKKSPSMTKF